MRCLQVYRFMVACRLPYSTHRGTTAFAHLLASRCLEGSSPGSSMWQLLKRVGVEIGKKRKNLEPLKHQFFARVFSDLIGFEEGLQGFFCGFYGFFGF